MKKPLLISLAVALLLAACGGASGATAATVDEATITVGEVESLMDIEESTIPKDQFATFLGFEIQWEIITTSSSEQWDIEISEDEITAEADRIYESVAAEGESREDFLASRGVTEEFLVNIAHQALLDQAIRVELEDEIDPPSQEDIDAEMDSAVASLTEVCVSHILVSSEEEAREVLGRLDGGEEFGELATEVSQDTASAENNGILPCGPAGQYAPEFRDAALVAPIGEVYDEIVQTQFGFHVMKVTDRQEPDPDSLPSEEELVENLRADLVALELNAWFLDEVAAADVTVEERYGTWQALPEPTVIPPST